MNNSPDTYKISCPICGGGLYEDEVPSTFEYALRRFWPLVWFTPAYKGWRLGFKLVGWTRPRHWVWPSPEQRERLRWPEKSTFHTWGFGPFEVRRGPK